MSPLSDVQIHWAEVFFDDATQHYTTSAYFIPACMWNHWEAKQGVLKMLMQRCSMTKTTGWGFLHLKGSIWKLTKDNFMHHKLTIRGNHCWWSDIARGFYIVLVHPCLSQGHHTGDAFSWPCRWRWSTTERQRSPCTCPYRSRQTPSAGQMRLADSVWLLKGVSPGWSVGNARSEGSSSGYPAPEGVMLVECKTCLLCSSTDLPWLLDGIGGADTPRPTNFTIVINKNRTLTKPHLLLVTLLNVKSNNQPLSSQNEINHVSV